MAPRGPKTAPRQPQEGPKRLRMAPVGAHESPRCIAMASGALPTTHDGSYTKWQNIARDDARDGAQVAMGGPWEVQVCPPS